MQDAVGGTLLTVLRAGNGPRTLSHPKFALLGRHSTPDQHRQTNRLYRRMRIAWHSVNFPATTANVFWRPATLASHAQGGFAATTTRCSPMEPMFGTRATTGCDGLENQREYDGGWSIPGPSFGRPGADQASSPSGALLDLNGDRTRFLVPPSSRSQHVPSGDST